MVINGDKYKEIWDQALATIEHTINDKNFFYFSPIPKVFV